MPDVEQVPMLPRLGARVLVGRLDLRAENGRRRATASAGRRGWCARAIRSASPVPRWLRSARTGDQADGDHGHPGIVSPPHEQRQFVDGTGARPDAAAPPWDDSGVGALNVRCQMRSPAAGRLACATVAPLRHLRGGAPLAESARFNAMPWEAIMSVARVTEIISSSDQSFEHAVKEGVERANQTLENIKEAWVASQKVVVESGRIVEYRVTLKVTFVLR
jgi:flavin-binding protein dodecin